MTTTRFALVGSGWRSQFFHRLSRQAPDAFAVTGVVTRSAARMAEIEHDWGVPAFGSLDDLVAAERPDFVIVSVPWAQSADTIRAVVAHGLPVLAETPPAADLDGLRALWSDVGASGLVQVAEQYLLMPNHTARLALARRGTIGEVTSVQVSSTHLYHAVSMIRGLLGVGGEPVTVTAQSFSAPLADPLTPDGWTGSAEPADRATTLATLDFGRGRSALYDFTDNQWWNPLRHRRIVVRGSLGEIVDDTVVRLFDPLTPVTSSIVRRRSGVDLDLEGVDLHHVSFDGEVLYRNAYVGSRFSDDDLAVVELLAAMGRWRRDEGPAPYPLAEGCQDHLIGLAIGDALAAGAPVTTGVEPWSAR